jgi:tRNA-dihydrouridine synthase B
MALRLGSLTLSSTIVQSPLAACSDLPFRLVAREKGLGFCFTEMVSAQALVRRNEKTLRLLKTVPADRPLGAQLLGCDPAQMAESAAMLEEMGFDLIDLNLGCPVRKVTANGEGSALLKDPDRAEAVFKAVRAAAKKTPVTFKTRKGFEDPSGDEAVALARRAEAQGFDAVTIHGRTRQQLYSGRSDYEAIGKVKRAVKITVIGNGDVVTREDAMRIREISGCDGVMIGRAGLGNPWVYKNLESETPYVPSVDERRDALLKHLDLSILHLGERQAAVNARRFVAWYTFGLANSKALRGEVCKTMDPLVVRKLLVDYFDALPRDLSAPQSFLQLAEA